MSIQIKAAQSLLLSLSTALCIGLPAVVNAAESSDERKTDLQQIAQLSEQIKLEPKRSLLYAKRGQCYVGLEDWQHALEDTSAAISIQPKYSPYYVARASIYNGLGKHDLEKSDLEKAIAIDPNSVQGLKDLAVILVIEKDGLRACSLLTRAVKVEPQNPELYLVRAEAEIVSKNISAAENDCKRAAEIEPSNKKILVVQREIHIAKGLSR